MKNLVFLKQLTKSDNILKTIYNSLWMMSDKLIMMFVSLFVSVLVARYLGPKNFGLINYSLSIISVFSALTSLGLESFIIKGFVDKDNPDGKIIGTGFLMQFAVSVISILSIYLIVRFSSPTDYLLHIISLVQSFYLLFQTSQLFDCWFQSRLRSKYVTISRLISHLTVSGFKLYLVVSKGDIIWFAAANVLDYAVYSFFVFTFYRKQREDKQFSFSLELSKSLLSKSWPFILSGLFVTVYMRVDQIMLKQMLGDRDVGIYSAGSRIAEFWYFVPLAIINSARPGIMELKARNSANYMFSLELLFGFIFWFCIIVALITTLLANPVCRLLYGPEYTGAGVVLSISVWAGAFSMLGSARSPWIICENLQTYTMYYILFGMILKLLLNLVFIHFYGIAGAAFSTLFCQFSVALIFPLFFAKTKAIVYSELRGIYNIKKYLQ